MSGQWLTLPETASRLGISVSTARRWIREGKLYAEKHPSPYGLAYRIPSEQVTTAQEITEVVKVEHPVDVAHLAKVLDDHLRGREYEFTTRLEELQDVVITALTTEVRETMQKQVGEITLLRGELHSMREELAHALQPKPAWWQRVFPWWAR